MLPFMMIEHAMDEGVVAELGHSTFKKYNKEFRRAK